MFEKPEYKCPNCGFAIGEDLSDNEVFACGSCGHRYSVVWDEGGHLALFDDVAAVIPPPLFIPRGSIRAMVALMLSFCALVLVVRGREVPAYLLSLLLTTVAYYFGFRRMAKAAESRVLDPGAEVRDPLHLPAGCVRGLLVGAFIVISVVLFVQGRLLEQQEYLQFVVILGGLIVGRFFHQALLQAQGTGIYAGVNHLKGGAVLIATVVLCALILGGMHARVSPAVPVGLACVLSFYYGSRS
jgi:DNA-directed RNA polymerase subunit RPC12/RpoP